MCSQISSSLETIYYIENYSWSVDAHNHPKWCLTFDFFVGFGKTRSSYRVKSALVFSKLITTKSWFLSTLLYMYLHRCAQIAIHEQKDWMIIRRKSYICFLFSHPFELIFPFTWQGPLSWGMIIIFMRKCFCYPPLLFPHDDYNGFNKSPPYWIVSNINIVIGIVWFTSHLLSWWEKRQTPCNQIGHRRNTLKPVPPKKGN